MKELNNKEKIQYIIKKSESHEITSYEISKYTNLSVMGIHNILSGETKNPRGKTLDTIIQFIDDKISGSIDDQKKGVPRFVLRSEMSHIPRATQEGGVPYFNVDFSSGYDLFMNNQTINPDFYINYEPYNHADLWVNNVGNSMSPKIDNGDLVALQKKSDITQMLYGEIYAIVFPEIRTIKYVRKSRKDNHIRLVPHDLVNFDEQDMPTELIQSFFLVLGSIKKFF